MPNFAEKPKKRVEVIKINAICMNFVYFDSIFWFFSEIWHNLPATPRKNKVQAVAKIALMKAIGRVGRLDVSTIQLLRDIHR